MTNLNNAAQAAEQEPLSDEYVNAVIRQHGYDSPEAVIARLGRWIGLNGGENSVTLLMYEAHKALSKLRAEGVQAGDERAALDAVAGLVPPCASRRGNDFRDGYLEAKVDAVRALRRLASAPVAKPNRAPVDDGICWSSKEIQRRQKEEDDARAAYYHSRASAPVAVQEFKAAFPNGVLTSARFHELWERAGKTRNGNYTLLENLTWQVGQFGNLVAQAVGAPVAGEAKPVAEVVSRYGDPEAFGERDLKVLVDLNSYPYGAKFYAAPQASADPVGMVLDERRDTYRLAVVAPGMKPGAPVYAAPQADKDGGDCAKGAGDERAEFEAWAGNKGWPLSPYQNNCGIVVAERYGHRTVQKAWEAWQAARAPTPSVVKQSLTATQTGEKGESE